MTSKIIFNKILLGIILLGALLRFIGTSPGYPPIHTDEGITHSQGIAMILERTLDPKHGYGVPYNYPIMVPLVNAIFYLLFFIPLYSFGYLLMHFGEISQIISGGNFNQLAGIFDQNILGAGRINVIFWGRYVTAFFGVGVVFMTYLVGKRLFNSKTIGLLSSFFVAINFREVLNSHLGLPDIYNAFFLLIALYQIIRLGEKQTLVRYILTGIAIALFFSTKFQFFALPPLLLILIFISFKQKKWNKRSKFFLQPGIFLMIFALLGTAFVLNIFHIFHWRETLDQVGYSALKYRYGKSQLDFYPISYLYHFGIGPVMSFMAVGGILSGIIFNFRKILILLSVIIPFLWMFAYFTGGGFYTRNFVTIIPVILICSGFGCWYLWQFFSRISSSLALIIIVIIISFLSLESLSNSLVVPIEYSKTWNYKLLQNWLGKNLPAGASVLVSPSSSIPVRNLIITEMKHPGDYFLSEMQDSNIDWMVINLDWASNFFYWWMNQDTMTSLKFWNKPVKMLSNSVASKSILELKNYIVFEALNPWQAPDNNFLVVKIPPKITFNGGKIIYQEEFGLAEAWKIENDSFVSYANFSWDQKSGFGNPGSLAIYQSGGGSFSQRFVSPKIPVFENYIYKITGMMRASNKLNWNDRDGFLGVDFLSKKNEIIKTSLSKRLWGSDQWVLREIVSQAPKMAKYVQVYFQTGTFSANIWLDDVRVWQSGNSQTPVKDSKYPYIESKFNLKEHLFLNSNGGM